MTAVAFFADRNFIAAMHVALASTLAHWGSREPLEVHLFQSGWTAGDLACLQATAALSGRCRLQAHAFELQRVSKWRPLYGTHMAYGRLFLPDLLPDAADVFYMDADVIVEADLRDVISGSRHEGTIAALGAWDFEHSHDAALARRLGIPAANRYFHSGLLLMDLEWCRRSQVVDRFLRFGDEHARELHSHDQTILNFVLHQELTSIPGRFTSHLYPLGGTEESEGVIHSFCGAPKPFDPLGNLLNAHFAKFQQWIARTALKDWSPNGWRNMLRVRRNLRLVRPMAGTLFRGLRQRTAAIAKA